MCGKSYDPHEVFNRQTVRSALKLWDRPQKLGQHPLAQLTLVKIQRQAMNRTEDDMGRGRTLRDLIRSALERLKPDDGKVDFHQREWWPYSILKHQYIEGWGRDYLIAEKFHTTRRTYHRAQAEALDKLVNLLRQWEEETHEQPRDLDLKVPFLAPPPPTHTIVGREALLHQLKQRLLNDDRFTLFALHGLPGVGKTAVALALVYDRDVLAHFQDGILWAPLGRQGNVHTHLTVWARGVGIAPEEITQLTTVEDKTRAIHNAIGMRQMLLIVDDVWEPDAALTFKLGGPHCAHIVTTRLPEVALHFAGDAVIKVNELTETGGQTLLAQFVPQVVTAEPDQVQELVRVVGGLPLALMLMGKYLKTEAYNQQPRRLQAALERLQQTKQRLRLDWPQAPTERHPSLSEDIPISLQATISISDEVLDPASQGTLRALSVFPPKPNTFSEAAALIVSAESTGALDTLWDQGLLEVAGPGRYTLHQTIADYAHFKLTGSPHFPGRYLSDQGLKSYAVRHARYFENVLYQAYELYQQGGESLWRGIQLLDSEWDNIQAGQAWAETFAGEDSAAALLCSRYPVSGGTLLTFRLRPRERARWSEAALAAARHLHDQVLVAKNLTLLGLAYFDSGDFEQAEKFYTQALNTLGELNDPQNECDVLAKLGLVHAHQNNFRNAIAYHKKAIAMAQNIGDRRRERITFAYLGSAYMGAGELDMALTYHQHALTLAREDKNRLGEAVSLNSMAIIHLELKNSDEAIALCNKALPIVQEMGYLRAEGDIMANLGWAYALAGERQRALVLYTQSLVISREIENWHGEAITLNNMAESYLDLNLLDEALATTEQVLAIAQKYNYRAQIADAYFCRGRVLDQMGQRNTAVTLLQEALEIFRQIDDKRAAKASQQLAEWQNEKQA